MNKNYFLVIVFLFLFGNTIFQNFAIAQDNTDQSKPAPRVQQIPGLNAKFIVALISDGEGGAWIGTEDEGVFHCDSNNKISRFTTKHGLGDNNGYALAIDKLGRLWVGHLNTGVSVYNGKEWKNYDVIDGPIGERIFDIKVCSKDGDVWIATSAGITRYKINSDDWEHITRGDFENLLEDQASALAFKNDGTLIVGTQCHGLVIFTRNANGSYKHSKNIVAPDRFGPNNCSPVPLTPMGINLPSNQINDIIVTKNSEIETIWIATSAGLVKMNSSLTKLEYWRGKNYAEKIHGLYGGAPKDFKQAPPEVLNKILPEDYLTCLAEDEQGAIWIGTRQTGFAIADSQTGSTATSSKMGLPDNFITKILLLDNGNYLVGSYGRGIIKPIQPYQLVDRKPLKTKFNKDKIFSVAQNNFPELPTKIKPPTLDELKLMQTKLDRLTKPLPKVYAAYLSEDWKTQGNWVGRTYRDWAILWGVTAPSDHPLYFTTRFYYAHACIGPNSNGNDIIRRWIHWLKTDDCRTLYDPCYGYRRQAELDDHGEAYVMTKDGPDLWCQITINHTGIFKVGMYFFNKDGHAHQNKFRDYTIEIYPTTTEQLSLKNWQTLSKYAELQTNRIKPLAKSRIRDFWGGVHKQFIVRGPARYFIKVDRNYSYNTILSSISIDRLEGEATFHEQYGIPRLCEIKFEPPELPKKYESNIGRRIGLLWNTLDVKYGVMGGIERQRKYRMAALYAASSNSNIDDKLFQTAKSIKWRLNIWNDEQLNEWQNVMKIAHDEYLKRNPEQKLANELYEKRIKNK
jgi:frataxin-like iron-binding protein CyaY